MKKNNIKTLNEEEKLKSQHIENGKKFVEALLNNKKLTSKDLKEMRDIATSDFDKSEVITNLSKRVHDSELIKPEYSYILVELFSMEFVFNGTKDVDYEELKTDDSTNPYDDNTINDFNAGTNIVGREVVVANQQYNVKTKILDEALINFKANPSDAIISAYTNAENINKTQQVNIEKLMWNTLLSDQTLHTVDLTSGVDDIEVNKFIYDQLVKYQTTSKIHTAVGINGVIQLSDGTQINPSKRYLSNEFFLICTPNFTTNTVFDGERSFFNWDSNQLELAGKINLDFELYEGMNQEDKDVLSNTRAILIHKDSLLGIIDWDKSKLVNGAKLYSVIHNYQKIATYKRKDKPVIIFNVLPEAKTQNTKAVKPEAKTQNTKAVKPEAKTQNTKAVKPTAKK